MRLYQLPLVLAAFILGTISVGVAYAWTGPTQAPPSGNVAAPINVGTTDQVKNGGLGVNSLAVFGNSLFGGSTGSNAYLNFGATVGEEGSGIRDNAGLLEFKSNGGTWESLQATVFNLVGGTGSWAVSGNNIYNSNTGNVGIGTASPQSPLHIFSTFNGSYPKQLYLDSNGYEAGMTFHKTGGGDQTYSITTGSMSTHDSVLRIVDETNGRNDRLTINPGGTVAIQNVLTVNGGGNAINAPNGNIYAGGAVYQNSDARLKEYVQTISGLDIINKLRGVTFNWKDSSSPSAGVIAQEVEQVMPEAVHTDASGMKSVAYNQLIAPLIEAVKEQQQEIESLKAENAALRRDIVLDTSTTTTNTID